MNALQRQRWRADGCGSAALPAVRRRGDAELPLARLLRLSLFQVSVGMAHGAADRHAEPRDDRRARRAGLAGRR
jgi:hypothetical protein